MGSAAEQLGRHRALRHPLATVDLTGWSDPEQAPDSARDLMDGVGRLTDVHRARKAKLIHDIQEHQKTVDRSQPIDFRPRGS